MILEKSVRKQIIEKNLRRIEIRIFKFHPFTGLYHNLVFFQHFLLPGASLKKSLSDFQLLFTPALKGEVAENHAQMYSNYEAVLIGSNS